MTGVADFVRRCLAAGMPLESALLAAEQFEDAPKLTARQQRNARYYESKRLKASEKRLTPSEQDASKKRLKASETVLIKTPLARVEDNPLRIITLEDTSEAKASSVEAPPKKARRLDPGWSLSPADRQAASNEALTPQETDREADKFRDFFLAKAGRDGAKHDWPATWRNWIRRAGDDKRKELARRPKPGGYGSGVEDLASIAARRQRERANGDPIPDRGLVLLSPGRM